MPQVTEINHVDQLDDLCLTWRKLWHETRGRSFFQTLEWLKCYWRHFGRQQQLRVLVVRSGGETLGIVPLVVVNERTRLGRIRVLTYPLADWGCFYGPIGPEPTATLLTAMHHLRGSQRDWDMIDLRFVDKKHCDHTRSQTAMLMAGFTAKERIWKAISRIDMDGGWDAYWQSRTSKFRNNLRRDQRRAMRRGQLSLDRYRADGDGCDDRCRLAYETCVSIANRSWQAKSSNGTTLSHPEVAEFFQDTHEAAVELGMADIAILKIDGHPIAFGYNYIVDGHVSGMRMGFDPSFQKCGAGNLLYWWSIRDSFRRGDHTFDLGPDFTTVKRHWTSRVVHSYRYTHYAPAAPKAQLLRLKHWLADRPALEAHSGA